MRYTKKRLLNQIHNSFILLLRLNQNTVVAFALCAHNREVKLRFLNCRRAYPQPETIQQIENNVKETTAGYDETLTLSNGNDIQ